MFPSAGSPGSPRGLARPALWTSARWPPCPGTPLLNSLSVDSGRLCIPAHQRPPSERAQLAAEMVSPTWSGKPFLKGQGRQSTSRLGPSTAASAISGDLVLGQPGRKKVKPFHRRGKFLLRKASSCLPLRVDCETRHITLLTPGHLLSPPGWTKLHSPMLRRQGSSPTH